VPVEVCEEACRVDDLLGHPRAGLPDLALQQRARQTRRSHGSGFGLDPSDERRVTGVPVVGHVDAESEPHLVAWIAIMAASGDRTTDALVRHDPRCACPNRNREQAR
jgi:hypothetical protein